MKKYIKLFKDSLEVKFWIEKVDQKFWVHFKGRNFIFNPQKKRAKNSVRKISTQSYLSAPLPGRVLSIQVKEGDLVREGQFLIVLESMKIEHTLTAFQDTKIKSILVQKGQTVGINEKLILFE